MHARCRLDSGLLRLVAAQEGVVTREQALAFGVTNSIIERLLRQEWRPLARGTYLVRPHELGFAQRAWHGVLAGGDLSAVGGEGALHLAGLRPEPTELVVWIEATRRPRTGPDVEWRRDKEGRLKRARGTLRRLRVEDAVIDLSGALDVEHTAALLADVLRQRATTPELLRRSLEARSRQPRRRQLRALLCDMDGVESHLEYLYRRDVERAHGLPGGVLQPSLAAGSRSDVWYAEFGVVVELDGRRGHEGGAFREMRRDNRLALLAQTTLRYGSADVRGRPCDVAVQVGGALTLRGWQEGLGRCRRCRLASP